jgi:6,7-dimethyl-8-ribityllumazine synthase
MATNLQSDKAKVEMNAAGLRFAIVVSRFNSAITDRLLAGAMDALSRAGAAKDDIDIVHVPGAFELPLAAKKLATQKKYDSLIAIGCVIRGETSHYDYVCSETARGLQLAQLDTGVPIIFCVLTCDTQEQAMARAGGKDGNKGFDSGVAAVEMARLVQKLNEKIVQAAPAGKLRRA